MVVHGKPVVKLGVILGFGELGRPEIISHSLNGISRINKLMNIAMGKCEMGNCLRTGFKKAGLFLICDEHWNEWMAKRCNVKGCDRPISTDDFGRWILCPSHKKWCETTEGYLKLREIGYKD